MRRTLAAIAVVSLALVQALPGQTVDFSKKPLQSERSRSYDALHYLVKIGLDLDRKSFAGAATITASSFVEGLESCVLDAEEFAVTSVIDEYGTPLRFEQSDKELKVFLARPAKFGEILTFTCGYSGREPQKGLRFVDRSPDNPLMVWSDSWPDNVHHWFPCFDYPNDKATSEIVATVKSGLKVASNGRLVGVFEDAAAGTVTYHWSQELPHSTYLIFLAAAPYVVVRDSYRNMPVNYWVYPGDEAKARPTYGKTSEMIAFFSKIFDFDYPWQKYDQISVPLGGGAESTSATAMTSRIMVSEEDEPDFPAIGIVSHELAHQWWGDLITLRSWGQAWVNESFGTYSDYLYFRHARGDDEAAVNLQNKLAAYLREAHTRYIRPIVSDRYDKPGDMFDSHSYPKGAIVLHMLRSILGDEIFFKTLSHFLHSCAFDSADTADFIRSVKTVTGRNLDWFFDQWLFKPGHPVFDLRSEWDAAGKVVRLKVAQVQDLAKGVPVFRVPVTVKVVTAGRSKSHRVWIREREETFEFPAETKPLLVRFDAANELIKEMTFPKETAELLYQLKNDDVIGRMTAAGELAAVQERAGVVAALSWSARSDPFWAVRRSAVEALAKRPAADVQAILKTACRDPHSSVRAAAVQALGAGKDGRLAAFYKDLFQKDRSVLVRAEALRALGRTGDASLVPFLRSSAAITSHQNLIKRAAEEAIKQLGK
ncbi:MAG TPA: M1 family aminopeptidase [Candidatus Aminicenantes bacterium]|nr:M1 family aminopeptidase [Candidatus Aminicenantes bacterium]HRY64568.1 M1 family aminopeptidase [Candidatus Aminicenantes bacterium]HRZ71481.1 M1 family aminopeptidase [Candidatus Aminicenantes bacterium]